jgi:outer membrane protein assembly factor BamB
LLAQSFTSKQWDETYNRANNKLPEIEELTEFSEIREDLSDILPKVARGFTEQALREQDAEKKAEILKKVDAAIALYSRPSYIPSSLRERPAVDKVIREVADKRREIDHQLTMEKDYRVALAEIRNMNAAGKTNDAIDQYQKLTSKYRELAARPELQQAIADASLAEQQNVKPVSLDWAAVNQEAPSPIDKTLVLATQTGSPAVGIENETVAYLVDGSVYQIKAGDGSILWRRYVGFQTRHDPVNIGNNLLVSDQNKKEIALVDGASGKLVWRLPIGGPYHQPRVQDQSILLTTAAGKLLRINAADGTISAACQLPQQTTVPCASNSSFVYQPGRHTNLYVMAADDMSCTSVNFVGADHVAGSISVPPTIVSGHLLLLVNGGDYSNLHVYRIEDDGKKLTEVQIFPRITKGVVNTPMFRFDRWVLLVSDIGDMKMLAINSTEADDPVSISVDEQFAVDEQMQNQMEMFGLKHYLSAKSGRLWIGNRGLSQYRIVKSQAKFDRKTWTNGSDVYLGPIVRKGDFILTLRRRNKSALASVSAIDPETHQQIWRTDFSAPLAGSVVKEDKSTFAVSSQGDIFPINESLLTSGYSGKPSSRGSEIIETLVFEDNVPLGPGKRVFYGPLARTKILNADIDAGQARVVDLLAPANKPSCPPIAFADQIIIASKSGQVAKVNPATGKTTLTPFQPEVQPGKPIRWCQPAIIDGTRFVIANGDSGMVYLLEATDVDIQSRFELDHQIKIMSPLVNVGEAVLAVDFDESRYRLLNFSVSDSIKLISSHELPADYVAGPMKFDSGVLLQLANNQLVFFAADKFAAGTSNSKPSWTVELRNQKLAGPPIDFGGNILLATQAGQLLVVNPATGEKIKSVELGQPIAGSPTLSGSQLLIGGRDGSVHVVSTDQLK